MLETRLLRRVIHYIWECYRARQEIKIRLTNHQGDELQVEEHVDELTVVVRYFARQPSGELVKQMEVRCYVLQHGEWIPIELYVAPGLYLVYATVQGERQPLNVLDAQSQVQAAGFCDQWALAILGSGFLAHAAKLHPLGKGAEVRPRWPQPTVPVPSLEQIEEWAWEDGGCEATDACWVEIDGVCPHGHPSWLLRLGLA
jgi:hypothetical protein